MSLLAALDYHSKQAKGDGIEIEYRLLGWGEIYAPFLGDREHSTTARIILNHFPFKLFSISIPYSEIPQKLCLTFRAPLQEKENKNVTVSSYNQDEIAREFAALLSMVTRRRIFAVGQTRVEGRPDESYSNIYNALSPQEPQMMREIDPNFIYRLLENLQSMDRNIAKSFILAIRLYHSAIEMMYSDPEFSYLFLVMSLESISSAVYRNMANDILDDPVESEKFIDSRYPAWKSNCDISTNDRRAKVKKMLLGKEYFILRKFSIFVHKYLPESFWIETEDDAKAEYIYGIVYPRPGGFGKEEFRHSDKSIRDYEKIDRDQLKRVLDCIYEARSKLVHEGVPLPSNIVMGLFKRISASALQSHYDSILREKDSSGIARIPPLITLERMVSYCLTEFLKRQELS